MPNPGDLLGQLAGAADAVRMDRDQNTREGLYQGYLNAAKANPQMKYSLWGKEMIPENPYKQAAIAALAQRQQDEKRGLSSSPELRDVEHGLIASHVGRGVSAIMSPTYSLAKLLKVLTGTTVPGDTEPTWEELKWGLRPWWGQD